MSKKNGISPHRPDTSTMFPITDLSKYDNVTITEDIRAAEDRLNDEYLTPWGLVAPPYAKKWIFEAALATDIKERAKLLEKARQKYEQHYLSQWSAGNIKPTDDDSKPMDEETKKFLKDLNTSRREQAKQEKADRQQRLKEINRAEGITEEERAPKRPKIPVFQDPDAQKLVMQKYTRIIPGTFKQDVEKPGGTNVDIKCDKCGAARTIHLADAFQVRLCVKCKADEKSKK